MNIVGDEEISPPTYTHKAILVVSGITSGFYPSEVVLLADSGPDADTLCSGLPEPEPPLNDDLFSKAGGILSHGGDPIVCGGVSNHTAFDGCFALLSNSEGEEVPKPKPFATLQESKVFSASIIFRENSGCAKSASVLWVTGGSTWGNADHFKSTDLISAYQSAPGPDLPFASAHHCLVKMQFNNDRHVATIAGYYFGEGNHMIIFDWTTKIWNSGPYINH